MRKKKAFKNISYSFLLEIVMVISGFIVPRVIIHAYGSDTNGLLNSIASFIGYIALLQSGVGSVVKAALYKPLADKDHEILCVMIKTTENFFRKISYATIGYIAFLIVLFPVFIVPATDFFYTASLVAIVGISTAAQYFLGITYQMLLEADQRSHVYSIIQIVSVILSTILVVILVKHGFSIQVVKLCSAVIFVLRPLAISLYTKKEYKLNLKVKVDKSLISQRWDGLAQAIAFFIRSKADIFVLTIFSTFNNVSIYSIYALVTTGLSAFINSIDKAVRSALGNILAKGDQEYLNRSFNAYNTLMHIFSTICFATAAVTIFKFVGVYVNGVVDADYIQPAFGLLIISAEFLYCLRMPYNSIVFIAGKFKETKLSAYVEAGINITVSLVLIQIFSLAGIAAGSLLAMAYRTISFIRYLHSNIIEVSYFSQIKRYLVTLSSYVLAILILSNIKMPATNYFQWGVYAFVVLVLTSSIVISTNLIFDRQETIRAFKMLVRK